MKEEGKLAVAVWGHDKHASRVLVHKSRSRALKENTALIKYNKPQEAAQNNEATQRANNTLLNEKSAAIKKTQKSWSSPRGAEKA